MWIWFVASALATDGTVRIPLDQWVQMLDEAKGAEQKPSVPATFLQIDRSVEGSFRRGVFTGTLTSRVRVVASGTRVPILDSSASIANVDVDGKHTSLLAESGNYTVAIDVPGDHVVRVEFFVGQDDDRFARRLQLGFPEAGPTHFSVLVPETGISSEMSHGTVLSEQVVGTNTRIVGQLDGKGSLDLSWKGRAATEAVAAKTEIRENVVFTLHEALVRGIAAFDVRVSEGELDRLSFRVPDGVEVVDVQGDSVLQWRSDAGKLEVFTRYLISDRAQINVHFQLPVESGAPLNLWMPLPLDGPPLEGAVGVEGPAGFSAAVISATGASVIRDLPPELGALTPNPLLLGFALNGEPAISLDVHREAEVSLTGTSVDEMEAATVIIEDGAEITRMQLHVRNETRPWLSVKLPAGAVLTHARVDGRAVRTATAADGESLLLPLPQSERFGAGQVQTWVVKAGDTLDALADRFYGDPSRWRELLRDNMDVLGDERGLAVGQTIRVAPVEAGGVAASRAVIELAWTTQGKAMGVLGRRELVLPTVDAEVAQVEWHVYVPTAFYTLAAGGNLAPWSHLRYDHVRRVQQFLDAAFGVHSAWAGSDYSSILSRRKQIFDQEELNSGEVQEASGNFPLVGDRHRFRRMMPAAEPPKISVTWMAREALFPVQWGALVFGAVSATAWAGGQSRKSLLLGATSAMLVVAWFVSGVHHHLVWGADVGLGIVLVRREWSRMRASLGNGPPSLGEVLDAWTPMRVVKLAAIAGLLAGLLVVPLLWSSLAFIVLAWKSRRSA